MLLGNGRAVRHLSREPLLVAGEAERVDVQLYYPDWASLQPACERRLVL